MGHRSEHKISFLTVPTSIISKVMVIIKPEYHN